MTPSKRRCPGRQIGDAFGPVRLLCLLYLLLLPPLLLLQLLRTRGSAAFYRVSFCQADAICEAADPDFFALLLVPATLLFTCFLIRNDFALTAILRGRNKPAIFLKQLGKTACFLLGFTLYSTGWVVALSRVLCTEAVSWGRVDSLYFVFTKQCAVPPPSLWRVELVFFFSSFLCLLTANTVLLLLRWITNRYLVSWLLILAVSVTEPRSEGLFFRRSSVWFDNWADRWPIERIYLLPLLCLALLLGAGIWYAKRKDFLHG
ncbi:MAG: hypothetical protein HFJ80_07970 [Clostridiales bacterium]|nr:hypothetical protein [Clostridiales bacterium]